MPSAQAALAILAAGTGGHRDDRRVPARAFLGPDRRRRLVPVHLGHLAVHQDRVVRLPRRGLHGVARRSARCRRGSPALDEHRDRDLLVDQVVLGQQQRPTLPGRDRWPRWPAATSIVSGRRDLQPEGHPETGRGDPRGARASRGTPRRRTLRRAPSSRSWPTSVMSTTRGVERGIGHDGVLQLEPVHLGHGAIDDGNGHAVDRRSRAAAPSRRARRCRSRRW